MMSVASWLGSAPHMRGILSSPRHAGPVTRISPAHAGNTPWLTGPQFSPRDQPRTCGEYLNDADQAGSTEGSAPHMRGILVRVARAARVRRISPAHAGNTRRHRHLPRFDADQPRTCGEYSASLSRCASVVGSAPHMRGIPQTQAVLEHGRRISPAHAGNTARGYAQPYARRDQPRTCGEYVAAERPLPPPNGSAPHMRGILAALPHRHPARRISPAHAGNTTLSRSRSAAHADQPRTCGEYERGSGRPLPERGSAPHMRGIHFTVMGYSENGGISPAHAGNTTPSTMFAICLTDQPRTCGEYYRPPPGLWRGRGSAPHMRGILGKPHGETRHSGISPAHAGNTQWEPR